MALVDPSHPLFRLLEQDRRYTLDAYLFVLEALSYAQEAMGLGEEPPEDDLEPAASEEPGERRTKSRTRRERRRV